MSVARLDSSVNPHLALISGAQSVQAAGRWIGESSIKLWEVVLQRLVAAGLRDEQVQVLWIVNGESHPVHLGPFPNSPMKLVTDFEEFNRTIRSHLPNVR